MRRMLRALAALAVMLILFTSGFTHRAVARAPHTIVKHFTPADRVSGRYQYVPFDVPAGTTTLRVAYDYNRSNGENVVDLGVFEPGSLDLGTPAFRGYSGGAKPASSSLSARRRLVTARDRCRPAPGICCSACTRFARPVWT